MVMDLHLGEFRHIVLDGESLGIVYNEVHHRRRVSGDNF